MSEECGEKDKMIYKIDDILLFFAAYAIMGWIAEVIFAALKSGKFVNRGFLNGPLCPIYGFGVTLVILMLEPVQDSIVLLFLGSFALTTVIEFITGFILEKVFHDHWWDYSKEPLNIKGYVCLRFSIMWGLACVMVIRVLHPPVQNIVEAMPMWLTWSIICLFYIYLFVDLAVTVTDIALFNKGMRAMARQLRDISDFAGVHISDTAIEIGEKGEDIINRIEEKKIKTKTGIEARRDAYEAFFSMPAVKRKQRQFKAFPNLKASLKERMLRETGEEYKKELGNLFDKTFGRK